MNPFIQAALERSGVIPAALNPSERVASNHTAPEAKQGPVHASGVAVSVSPYPIDVLPAVALCSDGTVHDYILAPFPGSDKQTPDAALVWKDADQRCLNGKAIGRTEVPDTLERMWLEIRANMNSQNPLLNWQFTCGGSAEKTQGTSIHLHTKGKPVTVRGIAEHSFNAAQSACRQQGATR